MASSFSKFYPQKACYVAMAFSYSKLYLWPTKGMPRCNRLLPILNFNLGWPTKGMLRCGQMVGCCWRRWQVAVGWLVSRVFLRQGVHTKMLISWQARVLERKCRFRGAGGVGGGAAPPPAAHQILIKQVLAAKMRLRSADTFNRLIALLLAWLVPVLLLCCGSWRLRLWLLSLLLVLVAVVVGPNSNSNWSTPPYKSLSRRSEPELELEPVHPPRVDNCVVDPNPNSNSNRSTPPGSIIVLSIRTRTRTRTGPPPPAR